MTRTLFADIPQGSYANGVRTSAWRAVPDAATQITMRIAVCTASAPTQWPNASTTLAIQLQSSLDGSTVFSYVDSGVMPGGIHVDPKGLNLGYCSVTLDLPAATGRFVRLKATIAGGPLVSLAQVGYQ